ncbi:hypothetical protein ACJ41O_015072 [Fusarium nematophilum]
MLRGFQLLLAAASSVAAATLPDTSTLEARQANVPKSYQWTSTAPLISAKNDGRGIKAIKDPSIIQVDGKYHVFASTASQSGYNLVYLSFTDFNQAQNAQFHYLEDTPIGKGYRAAPQVFYFAPQKLWYLVYQNGNAAYSTNKDINNPNGWTAPKNFYSAMPDIIRQNIGNGNWVDMWVICDSSNCHLFSSDDNGHLYRSSTSLASFPNGFGNTVIAMSDSNRYALFEASCVYTLEGGGYLLLVEAIGSDGQRYFRSWTASSLTGTWSSNANTESNPFARSSNVGFPSGAWTKSISHGEVIRTKTDQTLTIGLGNLRFLYQGLDPQATGEYNDLPWKLALITKS